MGVKLKLWLKHAESGCPSPTNRPVASTNWHLCSPPILVSPDDNAFRLIPPRSMTTSSSASARRLGDPWDGGMSAPDFELGGIRLAGCRSQLSVELGFVVSS